MFIDRSQTIALCISIAALCGLQSAHAAPGTDCTAAFEPYSADTLVYDLIINPATRAVLQKEAPDLTKSLPPSLIPADLNEVKVPSFTTILTLRRLTQISKVDAATVARLESGLAAVPVTQEAAVARCAYYDETPPTLPKNLKKPAVLIFDKIVGFHHGPAVDQAKVAIEAMAKRRGWSVFATHNGAVFNDDALKRFNVVIWNNVSGDVLTLTQQRAFRKYIEKGGGFAGFHGAGGDPQYAWKWYVDSLIGTQFIGHTASPQFPSAKIVIDDPTDAIVRDLDVSWTMADEWYSFKPSPRKTGSHVLATLSESSYDFGPAGGLRMGDHPIAWKRCVENGRSFYTAIGHQPESYSEPHTAKLLEAGIAWAAGLGETQCKQGQETHR